VNTVMNIEFHKTPGVSGVAELLRMDSAPWSWSVRYIDSL